MLPDYRINQERMPLHYKFSDFNEKTNGMELFVSSCITNPSRLDIYSPSRSDFFSVVLIASGEINIKLDMVDHTLGTNNLLFISPSTIQQFTGKTNDLEMFVIAFTSKFLLHIGIRKHEVDMLNFVVSNSSSSLLLDDKEKNSVLKLVNDLKEKNELLKEHPFGEDILQHTFRIFLYEIAGFAKKHNVFRSGKLSRKQELFTRFGELINTYFREHRNVKYYADLLAITPKYLTEVVNEIAGSSASELIEEKVMHEVKFLLSDPKLSIAQIADYLHFSDQSFFRKFFKRHSGVSPSEYRNGF